MDRPIAHIGVDPGASGAVALISDDVVFVEGWPGDPGAAADLSRKKDHGRADALLLAHHASKAKRG